MLSLVSGRSGGRWNKTADGSHWLRANAPSAPAGLARYSSLSHTHSCLCDHTYRIVDGLREQGRAVGETGQHELNQHEGEVDVESDVAKQVDLGILHERGGGGGHLLGATCGGRGEQAAGGPPLGRPRDQPSCPGTPPSPPQDNVREAERRGLDRAPGERVPPRCEEAWPWEGTKPTFKAWLCSDRPWDSVN